MGNGGELRHRGYVMNIGIIQMKMQTKRRLNHIIFLIVVLLPGIALAGFTADDFTIDSNGIEIGPKHININKLSPEAREDVLRRIRALLDSRDWDTRDKAAQTLLSINDDQTIRRIIRSYRGNTLPGAPVNAQYIADYGREAVIPYLIPDIYNDHGKTLFRAISSERLGPVSTELILGCIMNSKGFPVQTKAWAHDLNVDRGWSLETVNAEIVSEIKQWWEHNKDAINAKQYDKATWLPKEKIEVKS